MTLTLALCLVATVTLLGYHARRWRQTRLYREVAPTPVAKGEKDAATTDKNTLSGMTLSFLVPAWNAALDLPGFVAAYRALAYPHKELVLCAGGDDGSLTLARTLAKTYGTIKVLEQYPGEGKQRALARSYAACVGRILYLTDVDCRPDTLSVLQVLEPIFAGREDVVTGASAPLEAQYRIGAVVAHWATERKVAGTAPKAVDGVLGRNCALTRAAAEAIGRFCYDAPTGTDYRMAQRLRAAGYRIWFEPGSEIKTEYAWPLGSYIRKQARWLRNVVLYAERPRQAAEFQGALLTLVLPFGLLFLLLLFLATWSVLPATMLALLLLHGTLNRLHYIRENLSARHLRPTVFWGGFLNLLAALAAGFYATLTLLTPALRRQW